MIREIFEYILSFLKSRLLPLVLVFILLFVTILVRLFSLQIVSGDVYAQSVTDSQEKTMSVPATRGRIFDRNGNLLAYNDLAFSVKISDSGTYTSNKVKNQSINEVINRTIDIIEENGDSVTNDLPIAINLDGHLEFTESDNALLRFLRDIYGAQTISALKDEQRNATADAVYEYLRDRYEVSQDYPLAHQLEIINLRRHMAANSYSRYMTFTIAYEVSDATVAAILEKSRDLVGVSVEEEYIRKYVDSVYTSHILGYTGNVSSSELEELQAQNEQYESNDTVGKSGIEQALELELQGTKGSKKVYVDSVGRITEVVDNTQPQTGHDVYLTIDSQLQKDVYNAIEDVEAAMKGMLDPEFVEKVTGHAEVRQIFKASGVGTIAGSYVLDGTIQRDSSARIIRDGIVVHEGKLASIQRGKDAVKEVRSGFECGLVMESYNDIKEGDQIESFIMEEVPR